jgi:hypothetical protein
MSKTAHLGPTIDVCGRLCVTRLVKDCDIQRKRLGPDQSSLLFSPLRQFQRPSAGLFAVPNTDVKSVMHDGVLVPFLL